MRQWAFDGEALTQSLWNAPQGSHEAHETAALADLEAGAPYGHLLKAMGALSARGFSGEVLARQARRRWPDSIDIALLALQLGPTSSQDEALDHLRHCVLRQNRRREVLANAYLRAKRPDLAEAALQDIDPESATAAKDIHRRAELALGRGDFNAAQDDIDWLAAQEQTAEVAILTLRLGYLRDGARAVADWLARPQARPAQALAQAYEIAISENDFELAPEALARWAACARINTTALARARTRLAIERGDGKSALSYLERRLDMARPWDWSAIDHMQWLRTGHLLQTEPQRLLDHARKAARLHARHSGLFHLTLNLLETVEDWTSLNFKIAQASATAEHNLILARASLRHGLSAAALRTLAAARRDHPNQAETLRMHLLRAEAFAQAGRIKAARHVLTLAMNLALDEVQRAGCAIQAAEIELTDVNPTQAAAFLRPVGLAFPNRMVVPLTEARIAFQQGDFSAAKAANHRFNLLKTTQIGQAAKPDLRDRVLEDACHASKGYEATLRQDGPVAETIRTVGPDRIAQSPALSAFLILRARAQGALEFKPVVGAQIPRKIAHYWQGAPGPALGRAKAQWARLHPGFKQHIFDETTAADWLIESFGHDLADLFVALDHPALRADLFRAAWILREGGIFTDLDEYPRVPVTTWLEGAKAVLCIERGFGSIANNFIAATPAHELCAQALENICEALDHTDVPYAWWHTGPAQWTRAAFAQYFITGARDIRFLSQTQYSRYVATNLPYPHKRSPDHWR